MIRKLSLTMMSIIFVLTIAACAGRRPSEVVEITPSGWQLEEAYVLNSTKDLSGAEISVLYEGDSEPVDLELDTEGVTISGTGASKLSNELLLTFDETGEFSIVVTFEGVSFEVVFFVADLVITKQSVEGDATIESLINALDDGTPEAPKIVYITSGVYQGKEELGLGFDGGAVANIDVLTNHVVITSSPENPATLINNDNSFFAVFDVRAVGVVIEYLVIVRDTDLSTGQAIALRMGDATLKNLHIQSSGGHPAITIDHGFPGTGGPEEGHLYSAHVSNIIIDNNIIEGIGESGVLRGVDLRAPIDWTAPNPGTISNVIISNNTIKNVQNEAIRLYQWFDSHSPKAIDNVTIFGNSFLEVGTYIYQGVEQHEDDESDPVDWSLYFFIDLDAILASNTFDNIAIDSEVSDIGTLGSSRIVRRIITSS